MISAGDTMYQHTYPSRVGRAEVRLAGKTVVIAGDCVPNNTVVRHAISMARRSTRKRAKHAAVIFDRGRVVCSAVNADKTHPRGAGPYTRLHAEVRALLKIFRYRNNLRGLKLLVVRVDGDQKTRTSKPCVDCIALIKKLGIQVCWSEGVE